VRKEISSVHSCGAEGEEEGNEKITKEGKCA